MSASLWRTVRADLGGTAQVKRVPGRGARSTVDILMLPGTWAVVLFRVSSRLHQARLGRLARLTSALGTVLFGCDLDPAAQVGDGLVIAHASGVAFGPVRVGVDARIMGNVRLGGPPPPGTLAGIPCVGDECWFFDGAKVLGPVNVGDRSVISANTVVVRDVAADAVVLGNPGRVIRYRNHGAIPA